MDSRDLQGLMEAYVKVCAPVDEAVYGGEPKKPEDTRMVVTAADKKGNTKAYQNYKAGHKGYKAADHLGEESVDEAVKGASPHAMQMRKDAAAERRGGDRPLSPSKGKGYADQQKQQIAYMDKVTKKNKNVVGLVAKEELDIFDAILEYLVAEGHAATNKEALVIMANMSEEWRSEIVEAYVDYTKGKLSTGKSPQQRLAARHERVKATAARERGEASSTDSLMTPATKRSQKLGSVRREMDAHTGLGGKINKALSPGLGGRAGASPRVAYGEPNTDRHQLARFSRGQSSTRG